MRTVQRTCTPLQAAFDETLRQTPRIAESNHPIVASPSRFREVPPHCAREHTRPFDSVSVERRRQFSLSQRARIRQTRHDDPRRLSLSNLAKPHPAPTKVRPADFRGSRSRYRAPPTQAPTEVVPRQHRGPVRTATPSGCSTRRSRQVSSGLPPPVAHNWHVVAIRTDVIVVLLQFQLAPLRQLRLT